MHVARSASYRDWASADGVPAAAIAAAAQTLSAAVTPHKRAERRVERMRTRKFVGAMFMPDSRVEGLTNHSTHKTPAPLSDAEPFGASNQPD
jgi:hypothetical protein